MFFILYFLTNSGLALYHFDNGANLYLIAEYLPFLVFLPIAISLSMSSTRQTISSLQLGSAIGVILVFVYQTGHHFISTSRWSGVTGNPGPFSIAMLVLFAVCLISVAATKNNIRIFYILVSVLAAICIWMSGMRGAVPLIIILPMIIVIFSLRGPKAYYFIVALLLITVGLTTIIAFTDIIDSRFSNLETAYKSIKNGNYESSLGVRYLIWEYASQVIKINPFAGIGETDAMNNLREYMTNRIGLNSHFSHFHNMYFSTMVRGGILELVTTLLLLMGPLFMFAKHRISGEEAQFAIILMTCLVSIYLICGLSNIAFSNDVTDHLFIIVTAVCARIALIPSSQHTVLGTRIQVA